MHRASTQSPIPISFQQSRIACDRFKQLRAGLLTDSADVERAGQLAGCYFAQRLQGIPDSGGKHAWPPAEQLAVRIADVLSVQPPAEIEAVGEAAAQAVRPHVRSAEQDSDDVIDMLILVLDAANEAGDADSQAGKEVVEGSSSEHALEWADGLLRWLNHVPGFRDSVLLSLVLAPACHTLGRQLSDQEQQQQVLPNTCNGVRGADFMPVRRPLQSHQAAGLQPVATDARCMAIVVHRLAGVIRQGQHISPSLAACCTSKCRLARFWPTCCAMQSGPRHCPGPRPHHSQRGSRLHSSGTAPARGCVQAGPRSQVRRLITHVCGAVQAETCSHRHAVQRLHPSRL